MNFPMKGRRIVISGGTSGIGREMVAALHADNEVVVIARDARRLDELAEAYPGVVGHQADLSVAGDVERAAGAIIRSGSAVDVLVNNAAVQHEARFLDPEFELADIRREIEINFTAVCCLTSLLLPVLVKPTPSQIVNVNSGLGLAPKTSSAVYCATKGALNLFSKSLRYQLEGTNVAVLQAFLPLVDTAMTHGRGKGKIAASQAARQIIKGMERGVLENDIGKVKALRLLLRLAPDIAHGILKAA